MLDNEAAETSQGAVGLGNESVNNLVEAITLALQKKNKKKLGR